MGAPLAFARVMACWWGRGDPAAVVTSGVPCGSNGVAACSVAEVLPGALLQRMNHTLLVDNIQLTKSVDHT